MPLSTRAMLPADWMLIKHFKPAEFKYPERMGYQFMLRLDALRREAGVPCRVTSDYRPPARNKQVGGAKDSAHSDEICESVDIWPANNFGRYHIMRAFYVCGWERIGMYLNGSLHGDLTSDRRPSPRLWIVVENPA